ncbi:MAG TPA: NADH-quinone oxidoreductase subunit NuoH [Nitriliruptorales bacterium]|nr:NADH-quinone oxidoreductase subunit NuoH [Nitriliruptorales bacterium]
MAVGPMMGVAALAASEASTLPSALDFSGNLWIGVALKVVAIAAFFLVAPLVVGYMEHKVMAHQQARFGPMDVGPHGTLQLVADGVKFIQKEAVTPRAADRWVFGMAPGVSLLAALLVFLVVPLAPGVWAEDLELGLFYVLAASSVGVVGVLMAGWASANKFSLIGGVRAAAQLIAYELPMVLAAVAVALQAGTLSLAGIVEAQAGFMILGTDINLWYVFPQFVGFVIFFMAALAELARPPFDMPIADSELVFGYLTEYSGIRFGMFLLSEYAGMVGFSAIMAVLYLGGWQIAPGVTTPGCDGITDCNLVGTLLGAGVMLGKIAALSFTMIWVRVTYPRLREDQLQRLSWLALIPLSLALIAAVAVGKVVF